MSIPYVGDFSHIGAPIWEKSPMWGIGILYRFINDRSYCDFEAMDYSSCSDYFKAGFNESGKYNVYLDGHTVSVDCDFSSGEKGVTKFSHNKMETQEIENCPEKNCYKLDMKYDEPMEIIDSIKAKSTHCHQKITFSCFFSPLSMVGSWIDRFGNAQTYFSGNSGNHVCDCASSFVNECYQLPYQRGHLSTCNCDARDPVLRSDQGIITNMEALPIQSFNYGLMSSPLQNATITIGPLECFTVEQQPELTNVYVTNSYTFCTRL